MSETTPAASVASRDNERSVRSFMDHLPTGVDAGSHLAAVLGACDDAIVAESNDGIILSWNGGAERLYGYTPGEAIGRPGTCIVPAKCQAEYRRAMEALRSRGGRRRLETVRRRKDGALVDVMLTMDPMVDTDGDVVGIWSVSRDIRSRKRAEEAERDALARLRGVVDAAVDGIITIDERGLIESVNPATVRIFGYQADELIGNNVRMLMPEPFCSEHDQYITSYHRTGTRKIIGVGREVRGLRKNGSEFPMDLAVSEAQFRGRRVFTGIVRDITIRRRAEQALRESEERFRLLANSAPTLIWMSGPTGGFTWLNRQWLEFTGRTMPQELGDAWTEGIHVSDRAASIEAFLSAFAARAPFETEFRLRRFDGEYRWVHNSGAPIHIADGQFFGFIGSCVDITERKSDEEALAARVVQRTNELSAANAQLRKQVEERRRIESLLATENRMLELIAIGADVAELLDALSSEVESLIADARCAIRLTPRSNGFGGHIAPETSEAGTPRVDVFGAISETGIYPRLRADRLVVPHLRAGNPQDARLYEEGIRSYWFEPVEAPGGDHLGTLGLYRYTAGPLHEESVGVITMAARLAGIVVDRVRGEERAREQLAQLAHVARLATMGEMASGFAHELNQPLCAIVNFTEACVELVQRANASPGELTSALTEVSRQAHRAGDVIRRLRDFAKRRTPECLPVDMNRVVREVVALTSIEARQSDVRVRTNGSKRLPKVLADSIQIEQVLVNLVRNAFEAMRGTHASIRLLSIETRRRGGSVETAVSDTGPGISDGVRERLFEPFFTTKSNGLGTGLSISRSILEAHGGSIWVVPRTNGGTTFCFSLPIAGRAHHGRRNRVHRR